jgi:hypothetical protein
MRVKGEVRRGLVVLYAQHLRAIWLTNPLRPCDELVHLKHHSVYSEARCRTHCLLGMVSHLYVIRTGKDITRSETRGVKPATLVIRS